MVVFAIAIRYYLFDFVAAFFVFKLVEKKYKNETVAVFSFAAVLLAPTVILNGSYWGQCDIIYSAFLLASIYFLSKRKDALSLIMYGLSISFKLQAIFLFPIYIAFYRFFYNPDYLLLGCHTERDYRKAVDGRLLNLFVSSKKLFFTYA